MPGAPHQQKVLMHASMQFLSCGARGPESSSSVRGWGPTVAGAEAGSVRLVGGANPWLNQQRTPGKALASCACTAWKHVVARLKRRAHQDIFDVLVPHGTTFKQGKPALPARRKHGVH